MYKKIIWVLISVMIIFVSGMSVFSNSAGSSVNLNAEDFGGCDGCGHNNDSRDRDRDRDKDKDQNDDPGSSSDDPTTTDTDITDQSGDPQGNTSEDEIGNNVTSPASDTTAETTGDPNMLNADPGTSGEVALPKTGEENNVVGIVIGGSLILISAGYVVFRKKQAQ